MKVKLLTDIREGVQFNALGKPIDMGNLKASLRRGRETAFVKGAVIEMSDASGQKYIDAGVAEKYVEPVVDEVTLEASDVAVLK